MPRRGIGGTSLRLRENLARSTGLPFRELLTEEELSCLVAEIGVGLRDHLYTPVVTVLAFVAQILSDGSCRQAVGRVIATLVTEKQEAPSDKIGTDTVYFYYLGRLKYYRWFADKN